MKVKQRIKRTLGVKRFGGLADWVKTSRVMLQPERYIAAYWCKEANWGDRLSPFLISAISKREVVHVDELTMQCGISSYAAIGSILGHRGVGGTRVWGAGFLSAKSTFKVAPTRIHAVRGPLSREMVLRKGVECPEVYGDPGLLCPRFIRPYRSERYKLGIVPHYNDWSEPAFSQLTENDDVSIIDIRLPIEEFIQRICDCSAVASSSLHGLIAADAYGIPSVWIEASDNVLGSGFKFRDYFASVGRPMESAVRLSSETSVQYLLDHLWKGVIDIDLDLLWSACPFRPFK